MNLLKKEFDSNSTYCEHNMDASGIPSIFIHGVGLDNTMWLPQKEFFHNKKIIFYDLLNHGKSQKEYLELNFEDFIKQLNQLLEYFNIKKCNLIGFSIGALIAQHFTARYYDKINKLIIIGSVYKRTEEQLKKVKNRFQMALEGESITKNSINRWFNKEYLEKKPDVYEFFFSLLEKKNNNDFLPAYKLFVDADNYPLNFSNFIMPTLIMTGENEIGSTPYMSKMLHKEIQNSKLYIVSKAKHMVTYEKASDVNLQISEFLY